MMTKLLDLIWLFLIHEAIVQDKQCKLIHNMDDSAKPTTSPCFHLGTSAGRR